MSDEDKFIKQGSLMFLAVAVYNVVNLLYQLYMVRNLSPVDYGVLNSLFSILVIVSIPSGTLQTVVTKFISTYSAFGNHEKINFLLYSLAKKTFIFSLFSLLILIFGSGAIAEFLRITSPRLVVVLGVVTFFAILLPLTQGGLQGLQKFGYLGLTMTVNGGLKLLFGIIFVSIGFGVMGAMSALVIATFAGLVLSFVLLSSVLPKSFDLIGGILRLKSNNSASEINFSEICRYFCPVATVFFCFMILTNIDVVLVKHFFEPLEAGYYSIAQMAGKLILFLPIAITMVMFPKISKLYAEGKSTRHLLHKGLFYTGALCGFAALVCLLFPALIIRLLSGEEHLHSIGLVRMFSVTMVFFALVYVLLFYHLSVHHLSFIYPLVLITVLQIFAIVLFHQNLSHVLYIMCGSAVLLFLINIYLATNNRIR